MRRVRLWLIVAWIAVLAAGSLLPWGAKLALGTGVREMPVDLAPYPPISAMLGPLIFISPHRLLHIVGFFATALLMMSFAANRAQAAALAAASITIALAIEVAQRCLYFPHLEWWDIRDDTYGVLGAVLIFEIGRYLRRAASTV